VPDSDVLRKVDFDGGGLFFDEAGLVDETIIDEASLLL
jgi:hypothetical protein